MVESSNLGVVMSRADRNKRDERVRRRRERTARRKVRQFINTTLDDLLSGMDPREVVDQLRKGPNDD